MVRQRPCQRLCGRGGGIEVDEHRIGRNRQRLPFILKRGGEQAAPGRRAAFRSLLRSLLGRPFASKSGCTGSMPSLPPQAATVSARMTAGTRFSGRESPCEALLKQGDDQQGNADESSRRAGRKIPLRTRASHASAHHAPAVLRTRPKSWLQPPARLRPSVGGPQARPAFGAGQPRAACPGRWACPSGRRSLATTGRRSRRFRLGQRRNLGSYCRPVGPRDCPARGACPSARADSWRRRCRTPHRAARRSGRQASAPTPGRESARSPPRSARRTAPWPDGGRADARNADLQTCCAFPPERRAPGALDAAELRGHDEEELRPAGQRQRHERATTAPNPGRGYRCRSRRHLALVAVQAACRPSGSARPPGARGNQSAGAALVLGDHRPAELGARPSASRRTTRSEEHPRARME